MVKNKLKETVKSGLGIAVETAAKAWDPLQGAASKAGQAVSKRCQEGAATIVDAIKPVLTKVVKVIQEGMDKAAGGESKGHEEKDTKKKSMVEMSALGNSKKLTLVNLFIRS